jgi:hypothetical protein
MFGCFVLFGVSFPSWLCFSCFLFQSLSNDVRCIMVHYLLDGCQLHQKIEEGGLFYEKVERKKVDAVNEELHHTKTYIFTKE